MTKPHRLHTRVGILGAGQLSRMLAEAAHRLGLEVTVLASHKKDPAAQVCSSVVIGHLDDESALDEFFSKTDLITYENDFLPYGKITKSALKHSVQFVPELSLLEKIRDKTFQKKIFQKLGIPTSNFKESQNFTDLNSESVVKWALGGYDGKGVLISPKSSVEVEEFASRAPHGRVFVEDKISYRRELAILSAYSITEEFVSYPVVVTEQENGICKRVSGPASEFGLSTKSEKTLQDYAKRLAQELGLFGLFAIEFFEDADGKLFANEIAPRVHNSGHFSLDASETSQFENHWRAILGLPLGSTISENAFAMLNLLGGASDPGLEFYAPELKSAYHLHWYGKTEARPGRKLGHINAVAKSAAEVSKIWDDLNQIDREWLAQFSKPK